MGDFNFVLEEEGRFKGDGSGWTAGDTTHARLFHKFFPCLTELYQDQDTRRGKRGKAVQVTSRIDRIFTSLPPALLRDITSRAGVLGSLKSFMASDHIPVTASLEIFSPSSRHPVISPWIASLPEFHSALNGLLGEIPLSWGPLPKLQIAKDYFFEAASAARAALGSRQAVSLQDKHHWSLAALRALRLGHEQRLRQAVTCYPRLRVHFNADLTECVHLDGLCQHVRSLFLQILKDEEDDISKSDLDADRKRDLSARNQRRKELWTKFRRRTYLSAVYDDQGSPLTSSEASAAALRDYWRDVFKAPSVDPSLWDEINPFIQVLSGPLDCDWLLPYHIWFELITKRHHSMPGPDGIPYAVWKNENASRILYSVYLSLFDGQVHSLPDDMKRSLLVFLPKGSDPRDVPGCPHLFRHPSATRPLSMCNTDIKLLANAFTSALVDHTAPLVSRVQACARGRDMLANVVQAEAWGISRHMRGDKYSSLFLTDFSAAFPSLSTDWLFHVLRIMCIPAPVLRFYQMMYEDNFAQITISSR
eukprot:8757656-Pyramimonas_sp.AAC.1